MPDVFILRLQGVLQAWGGHTLEDFRPSALFPTRSGVAGLLGACLGIGREERGKLTALSEGFAYCARLDKSERPLVRIADFHTVRDARKVDGSASKNPVVSRREYLCDAKFTLALTLKSSFPYSPDRLIEALRAPVYTPFLGRRSCPLSRPLFEAVVAAEGLRDALAKVPPGAGILYGEAPMESPNRMSVRDVPVGDGRQFQTREVFIHSGEGGDVPEQTQD